MRPAFPHPARLQFGGELHDPKGQTGKRVSCRYQAAAFHVRIADFDPSAILFLWRQAGCDPRLLFQQLKVERRCCRTSVPDRPDRVPLGDTMFASTNTIVRRQLRIDFHCGEIGRRFSNSFGNSRVEFLKRLRAACVEIGAINLFSKIATPRGDEAERLRLRYEQKEFGKAYLLQHMGWGDDDAARGGDESASGASGAGSWWCVVQ